LRVHSGSALILALFAMNYEPNNTPFACRTLIIRARSNPFYAAPREEILSASSAKTSSIASEHSIPYKLQKSASLCSVVLREHTYESRATQVDLAFVRLFSVAANRLPASLYCPCSGNDVNVSFKDK